MVIRMAMLLLAGWTAALAAEAPKAPAAGEALTPEAIQERIKALEAAPDVPQETRDRAVQLYHEALGHLEAEALHAKRAREAKEQREAAPETLKQMEQRRKTLADAPEYTVPKDASLETLKTELDKARADQKAAAETHQELQGEAARRQDRRKKLPDLIRQAKDRVSKLEEQLAALPLSDDPAAVVPAREAVARARLAAAQAEVRALEEELASYEEREKLLPARIEVAGLEERRAKQRAAKLQARVDQLRRQQAETARQEAEKQLRAAEHPAVKNFAEQVVELNEQRAGPEGLVARIEQANQELRAAQEQLSKVEADFQRIQKRMDIAGMTNTLGVLLRKHRGDLPNLRQLRQEIRERQRTIADVELRIVELREARAALLSVDEEVAQRMARLFPPVEENEREPVAERLRNLAEQHRESLARLIDDLNTYFYALVDLQSVQQRLVAETERFAEFINEHVLWIQSAQPLGWREVPRTVSAVRWLLGPAHWRSAGRAAWRHGMSQPVVALLLLVALLAVLGARRRVVRRLDDLAERVSDYRNDSYSYTVRALLWTAVAALPGPLVLWTASWALGGASVASDLPKAVGAALWQMGWVWFPLGFFRQVCRPRGLGEVHFRWRRRTVEAVRRTIAFWLVAVLPLLFVVTVLEHQSSEAHKGSLGRLAFLAAMGITSVAIYRLMRMGGPLFATAATRADNRLFVRTRSLWFPVLVLSPLLLAGLAGLGYMFTAVHLFGALLNSFLLMLGLIVLRPLVLRWLSLQRRRVALRHMELQQKEAQQRREAEGGEGAEPVQVTAVDQVISLMEVREQTLRLVAWGIGLAAAVGLYLIWIDVLPALGILNDIRMWGAPGPTAEGSIVSLADLLLAVAAIVLAATVGRNLPGFLEVTLLHWLNVEQGTRYAVTALARYTVIAVAVVVVATLLGLRWSSIQWLVAALTVGLGFGLQEIFANFVSGLILLFERPIRVGDTVTIGDVSGTVTRIRIRATTIVDWDRKELVVPNREFITGRLINWTLSDSVIRVRLEVGIAYGSDTAKATECLMAAARECHVLEAEPAPQALFLGFGDSSLTFELRVYVQGFEHYFEAINELHRRIDAKFRETGIEIAFPQQDLHVRSLPARFNASAEPAEAEGASSGTTHGVESAGPDSASES